MSGASADTRSPTPVSDAEAPAVLPEPIPFVPPPTVETAGAEACTLEGIEVVGAHDGQLRSYAIAYGPAGGLVSWEQDTTKINTVPIDEQGKATGPVRTEAMPLGHRIHKILPVGRSFLLFTHAVCDDEAHKAKVLWCLYSRAFGKDGAPLGAPHREDVQGGRRFLYHELGPGEARVIRYIRYGGIDLVRYGISERGEVLAEERDIIPHLEIKYSRHCDIDGDRLSALTTDFGTSDSNAVLLFNKEQRPLVGVPSAFAIKACHAEGDRVALLWAPDVKLRPRFAWFGKTGRAEARPVVIKRGEPLPEPFTGKVVGRVKGEDFDYDLQVHTTIMFERRDSAGARVGEPLKVQSEDLLVWSYDMDESLPAWTGARFLVVHGSKTAGSYKIKVARISCSGTTSPERP